MPIMSVKVLKNVRFYSMRPTRIASKGGGRKMKS